MITNTHEAIDDLSSRLVFVRNIDISDLADQLITTGFECKRCGDCCRAQAGDNSVIIFPGEIRTITEFHHLNRDEVCRPSVPRFMDGNGVLHAFEWELNRNDNGDCIFFTEKNCSIYDQRPWICRTYPFYLEFEDGAPHTRISVSECRGTGKPLDRKCALDMARLLQMRLIDEIQEEIRLLKNLEDHDNWKLTGDFPNSGINGKTAVTVHDSRGKTEGLRYIK